MNITLDVLKLCVSRIETIEAPDPGDDMLLIQAKRVIKKAEKQDLAEVIDTSKVDSLPDRETETIRLKRGQKLYEFKICGLTGLEAEALDIERMNRKQKHGLMLEPQPPTRILSGKDIPVKVGQKYEQYLKEFQEYQQKRHKVIDVWYEYRLLEIGYFICNDKPIEGESEEDKILYVQKTLGNLCERMADKIIALSIVTDDDVLNF